AGEGEADPEAAAAYKQNCQDVQGGSGDQDVAPMET
ncbi:unnamed protein product, partial [Brassica oleracea var. botrytis]